MNNLINFYPKALVISMLSYCLASCNGDANSITATLAAPATLTKTQTEPKVDSYYQIVMGSGYDNVSNTATAGQSCLAAKANLNNIYVENPEARATFEHSQDLSALEQALNVDVSSKFGGDRFDFSTTASFANGSKNNAYTTNIIYFYKYSGFAKFKDGTLGQGDAALTPVARGLVHSDQIAFRTMCGNSYIEQMDAGATLAIRFTLGFNSHSDQEKFNAKFNANLGMADMASSLQQAAANSNVHVNFSVNALQLGGEPQKLNDIFGSRKEDEHYPYVECGSIGGMDSNACKKMIDAIIDYAQTLKSQLIKPDGGLYLERLYYSNPKPSSYATLGIISGAPDPSTEVLQAMQQLTQNYDQTVYTYDFINHYLDALQGKLDPFTYLTLQEAQRQIAKQISLVYRSPVYHLYNCYKGYVSEDCIKIKNNIDASLAELSLTAAQSKLINYLQTNSYIINLLVFDPNHLPYSEDSYHLVPSCVLTPISYDFDETYAANCEGKWLNTFTPLKVVYDWTSATLSVDGLDYYFFDNDDRKVIITYPRLSLVELMIYPGLFMDSDVEVVADPGADMIRYKINTPIRAKRADQNAA